MRLKKSICVISFSPIYRDARVLRQINALAPFYNIQVIGYGEIPNSLKVYQNIKWTLIDIPNKFIDKNILRIWTKKIFFRHFLNPRSIVEGFRLFSGRFKKSIYEIWFWSRRQYTIALKLAEESHCNAFLANDWDALPVAAEAIKKSHAKLIFDAHEYAPLQFENKLLWRIFFQQPIIYFLKKYSPYIDAAFTVSPAISERYYQEFGFKSELVLNAPENMPIPEKPIEFEHVKLVHHGAAIQGRKLENLIETLSFTHPRFRLHFILIDKDPGYLNRLKKLSKKFVPGRVFFEAPVSPEDVVKRISEFDIGLYLLNPTTFNHQMALPNKFFDFIVAGLAVCVGPSPAMAEFVNRYGFGWVAPSFAPKDMAETLNKITEEDLIRKRLASLKTSKEINASKEMNKVIQTFNQLLKSY